MLNNIGKNHALKVYFHNTEIHIFSSSLIFFWNGGRATINQADIAERDPIQIKLQPAKKLLEASLLFQSKQSNNVKLARCECTNTLRIDFDYLAFHEGCIIEIKFDGLHHDVSVQGTVKGVAPPKHKSRSYLHDLFFPIGLCMSVIALFSSLLVLRVLSVTEDAFGGTLGAWALILIIVTTSMLSSWAVTKRLAKSGADRMLENYRAQEKNATR